MIVRGIVVFVMLSGWLCADDHFESKVRPLLVKQCIACHGPEKQKGGLRLDTKAGWQEGGENGPALVPGKPDASLLVKAIRGTDGVKAMPPKGKLAEREIANLVQWVQSGAADPRVGPTRLGGMTLEDAKKWWAFQPIRKVQVPRSPFKNPIDAFLFAKQSPTAPADRRTLIRRVTYDLTGLPPTMAEVEAFEKDASPDAFAKVVDRLLASPHYGERWGRHWLDLVRYADTAGENSDHPVPHAWRYRNWVIDAFNADKPYDEFLREQIAGDILAAQGPPEKHAARIVATGFLAMARRFDHDSDTSMHLTHEDGIDTLGKALLGLTLGCARCHDHKYDAVSAKDYYALYGILASSKFSFPGCEAKQQPRDMVPLVTPAEWDRTVKPHRERMAKIEAEIRTTGEESRKRSDAVQAAWAKARQPLSNGAIPDGGDKRFDCETEVKPGEMLLLSILPLKNHGADTTLVELEIVDESKKTKWSATDDLLDDFLAGNPHADRQGNKSVWWMLDVRNRPTLLPEPLKDFLNKPGLNIWRNGDTPSVLVNAAKTEAQVWTKLPARSLFAHPAPDGNVALGWLSPIAGKVKITGRIKDAHPGGPDGVGWVLERFAVDVRNEFAAIAEVGPRRAELERQRAELMRSAPKQDVAYAVVEGTPADAKMHLRGDPEKLGEVVPRRWLEVLGGMKVTSGSGRLDLANWIASKDSPLTARVMVNRIWLHHFGKGLVPTPNDFGTRGVAPTHPELLDWLASEFVASGWRVKAMHRTILLSQAYQQSAHAMLPRRRLSAEEIRDSLLVAGGALDREPAQAHPFPPESAWSYTQHVPFGTFFETTKRSVYLVNVRNRRHPFLGLFDGADPNATTPERPATTVPTQALFFLNDPFFHAMAGKLAERVRTKPEAERVDELFRIALQRSPKPKDRVFAAEFLKEYGSELKDVSAEKRDGAAWAALARVLLASNEFLFVE
jgi:hypothetical protein